LFGYFIVKSVGKDSTARPSPPSPIPYFIKRGREERFEMEEVFHTGGMFFDIGSNSKSSFAQHSWEF
jgi:hypothetical protein